MSVTNAELHKAFGRDGRALNLPRLLLLGGTGEARRLAERLAGSTAAAAVDVAVDVDVDVVYSIAGRVRAPALPVGVAVRVGGFGGPDGLARYLRDDRIDAVVDATHPFAATMTGNAAAACAAAGVPLLVLRRPGWTAGAGDDWHRVPSLAAAVDEVVRRVSAAPGLRVFLTTGRTDLARFAGLDGCWFLVRSVDPPAPPVPAQLEVVLDRGPFTVDAEMELMRRHRIDVVVTKDSGGEMTAAKLDAARQLGLPVVMVNRPALPPGVAVARTVGEALAWSSPVLSSGVRNRSACGEPPTRRAGEG